MSRVAVITDLHIKQDGLIQGIDTVRNFELLVQELSEWQLDHIICAGDLSAKEPKIEDCSFVKEALDKLKVPYSVIRGNHDESTDLASVFGYQLIREELYYKRVIDKRAYLFLDTQRGKMSASQCMWLSEQLQQEKEPYIVMHYPPMDSGIIYMDSRHKFENPEPVLEILTSCNQQINIFCGHCHAERHIQYKNVNVFITPSCLVQVDERERNFKMYHDFVGFRVIEENKHAMRTFVKYLF